VKIKDRVEQVIAFFVGEVLSLDLVSSISNDKGARGLPTVFFCDDWLYLIQLHYLCCVSP